jgi:predicted GH43/DUF377 family glycosyl hydrolase
MADELAERAVHRLNPDPRRVITKLFVPGEEMPSGRSRAAGVIARIMAMDEDEVVTLTNAVIANFRGRHRGLAATFSEHFAVVSREIPSPRRLSAERRMLIGACFTHEYSPEGAALFNPSMAVHPDQSGVAEGELRFVMSVRCVGEGHLSSIGFRTGVLGPGGALALDTPEPQLITGTRRPATYERSLFLHRLADTGFRDETSTLTIGGLPESFSAEQLADALGAIHEHTLNRERVQQSIERINQVAAATYDLDFPASSKLTERLLWPSAAAESHGMEDARLVRFVEDDGTAAYYATYTAYDGARVAPHLLATTDLRRFHVSPLAGTSARDKGMALFPRRIGGRYVALSRWNGEALSVVHSDNYRVWGEGTEVYAPTSSWDLIQVGNGGPPIETPHGWLVITHSVGPMRVYSLGAMLLDLDDPTIVVAVLPEPLLTPHRDERDGYVPNVVYTCGSLLHDDVLTIPYGISDGAIGFAQVGLTELIDRMLAMGRRDRHPGREPRPGLN